MGYLIQIKLEATKIKEEKIVDDFIANIKTDFCNLQKIHKKSGYGCLLTTKFATLDEINSSQRKAHHNTICRRGVVLRAAHRNRHDCRWQSYNNSWLCLRERRTQRPFGLVLLVLFLQK